MTQLRATEGLADRVYRELLALIIQGDLQEGDRLSTEQAIADQFKTSRPTVREALSRLRADGIIASRQGAGTFVTRRPDPDLPRFMPLESLSDVRRCLNFASSSKAGRRLWQPKWPMRQTWRRFRLNSPCCRPL